MSKGRSEGEKPLLSFSEEREDEDEEAVDVTTYSFGRDAAKSSTPASTRKWIRATFCFGMTTVLAIGIAMGLGAGLGFSLYHNQSGSKNSSTGDGNKSNSSMGDVCTSHTCVKLSSQILGNMDPSVDPCEDFYGFACNGYLKDVIIPYGEELTGTSAITRNADTERIRVLMESGNNMSLVSLQKAITFYNSCMDTDTVEKKSHLSLHDFLSDLGGWPLVGIDSDNPWDINDMEGYVSEKLYGSTAFFVLEVLADDKNTSRNIFYIERSGLTINTPAVYQANSTRDLVKNLIIEVLELVNSSIPTETYENAAQEILDFETELSKISNFTHSALPLALRRNITSLDYMEEIFPDFDWESNMEYYATEGDFEIESDSPINLVAESQYFIDLSSLLNKTNTSILQNYAKWQMLFKTLPDLSSDFRKPYDSLQELLGVLSPNSRYKFCVKKVESTFTHAVARAFHEVYVLPGTVGNLTVVTTELKAALMQRIGGKSWLDAATKKRALIKANAIIEQLVYPKKIANNTFLNNLYSSYVVSPLNDYFTNAMSTMRSARLEELKSTTMANNRSNWVLSVYPPTVPNAAYLPTHNQIYIYEGILNIPFFKPYWPTFFQFATIGFTVGHEYTHGFDNTGQLYDENGTFTNWWTPKSLDEFKKRTVCFVNQYSKYFLDAGKVDGNLTLGENIADNGGLETAFLAYKNRVKKARETPQKLPGLSYSPDQLFFIGASQLWCKKATMKGQKLQLKNPHTPEQLRPKGFLSNSPEFAAAFNCPPNSAMNPNKKCELW